MRAPASITPDIQTMSLAQFMAHFRQSFGPKGSHSFTPLAEPLIAACFGALLDALLAGELALARRQLQLLDELGVRYRLVHLAEPGHGEPAHGFMERVSPGHPNYRGWGAALVRPARGGAVYQAPHVRSDACTEDIALRAFHDDPSACAAMFAGTNRYANGRDDAIADVAHATANLFHVLTEHLARRGQAQGAPHWFVQFHGCSQRHEQPAIIGSDGAPLPGITRESPLVRIGETVNRAGHISMGVCGWPAGARGYRLCATQNVQGMLLERLGLRHTFMHFEIDQRARYHYHARGSPGYEGLLGLLGAIREVVGMS